MTNAFGDEILEQFWKELEDVPFSENKDGELILEKDWLYFLEGTTREEIWHWFDDNHSKGVYWLLMEMESVRGERVNGSRSTME